MSQFGEFLLDLLAQFAGGPGAPENNLVRFGLAAIMWGSLLAIAGSRQRPENRPRERLLVAGFALALFRELFMLGHLSTQLISGTEHNALCSVVVPAEHTLSLTSMVLITGAFLRYILDDPGLARRYLAVGLSATAIVAAVALIIWPQELAADPTTHFHETDSAWFIHLIGSLLLVAAIVILIRARGWLRDVIVLALGAFLIAESFVLINFLTDRAFNRFICPIGNGFYLAAIPLFGLVYLREQAAEQRRTEASLQAYRDHLEELVADRTNALSHANQQLQVQIEERIQIEAENARLYRQTDRWAKAMSRLNELSLSLNATLDPAAIYPLITHQVARLLACPVALFYVWDAGEERARETAAYGLTICQHPNCSFLPTGSLLLAKLMAESQALPVEIAAQDGALPEACRSRLGERSMIGRAVRGTGAPLGFLFVAAASAGRHWSPDEMELLALFTDRAAIALENAYLHQQMEWATALEERQRIAAEMHDGLAQTLNYLSFKTDEAHEMLAAGQVPEALAGFGQIQAIIDQANHDVRTSIATLQQDPSPRRSVQDLLREIAARQSQDGRLAISVESALAEPLFAPAADLEQLARVVQEALVNAQRHGQARTIRLELGAQDDRYQLLIVDDGVGFDPDRLSRQAGNHFGLSIMRARAARLQGQLDVHSQPEAGTTVVLTWPGGGEPVGALDGAGLAPRQEG